MEEGIVSAVTVTIHGKKKMGMEKRNIFIFVWPALLWYEELFHKHVKEHA